jgi:hypothetical protein
VAGRLAQPFFLGAKKYRYQTWRADDQSSARFRIVRPERRMNLSLRELRLDWERK